ncbi:uncharacterized protein LOC143020574 isoform X2 [Oratosquilla oratoria]|uniref:uncharacterized protein LOC143020574 isoform X2 n=1 Tax=Oratosquilla oratoria TaxID=337810 RepID=UPI003F77452B
MCGRSGYPVERLLKYQHPDSFLSVICLCSCRWHLQLQRSGCRREETIFNPGHSLLIQANSSPKLGRRSVGDVASWVTVHHTPLESHPCCHHLHCHDTPCL